MPVAGPVHGLYARLGHRPNSCLVLHVASSTACVEAALLVVSFRSRFTMLLHIIYFICIWSLSLHTDNQHASVPRLSTFAAAFGAWLGTGAFAGMCVSL